MSGLSFVGELYLTCRLGLTAHNRSLGHIVYVTSLLSLDDNISSEVQGGINEYYKNIITDNRSIMYLSRCFDTIKFNFVYWNWSRHDLD